jgi:hypothetical protein
MINATKVFIYFLIIILVIGAVSKTIIDMPLIPNDKSVNVLLVYLIVVSIVTILGVGITYNIQPTTKDILPRMGDKGRRGARGGLGNEKKCGIKCTDNACYFKIMNHITDVYNLWLKANRRPLLGKGKLISNTFIKSKVQAMCNSELFSSLIQRHGSHKLLIKDNPMEANRCDNPVNEIDKTNKEDAKRCCNIKKDCGAYDYVFQMWTEWILTILKYEKGQFFLDSENMKDEDFNNMITDSDILKDDFTKEWVFNPGEPIGKVLNPKDATETEEEMTKIENTFFKSDFVKFYTAKGVPDAHTNDITANSSISERAQAKLKIKSPFEIIQEYDAWYWGSNPLSVPQFINKCEFDITDHNFQGKIKVKITNDYTEMWDSSEARQSKGKYTTSGSQTYSETFKPYQLLGSEHVKIVRPKDFYDNSEKNLDFRSYKPVGDVIVTAAEATEGKSSPQEHFPRFLKKTYNSLPNQNDTSGPRRLTILVSGDVKHPVGFTEVYSRKRDEGFQSNNLSFTVWRPRAPDGYVSLGDVVSNDPYGKPPNTSIVVCIPKVYAKRYGSSINNTYSTRGTSIETPGFNEDDYDTDVNTSRNFYFKTMNQPNDPPLKVKTGLDENSVNDKLRKTGEINKYLTSFNTFRCQSSNSNLVARRLFHSINFGSLYDDSEEDFDKGVTIIKKDKSGRKYSIIKLYE